MKLLLAFVLFISFQQTGAQQSRPPRNIFIITTDGFRWEELFKGADSLLISNPEFVRDTLLTKQMFWDETTELRRQKLMPFFWNVIARQGQLYGNRLFNNKANVKNFYKISYPGYNEILTGFADPVLIPNTPKENKNTNVLEYLNRQESFKGKVAAFSSWDILPFILNEQRSGFIVNSGYEMLEEENKLDALINTVQKNATEKNNTRNDMLTYLSAREYIEQHHPRALFLGLGETDEYAHHGRYDLYLQKAAAFDKMLAELWYYVQTDPFYKNNTTFIITTDHGRGKQGSAWRNHGFWIQGSGEVWMAMIGPDIVPSGEIKEQQQLWQKQIAATAALLVGEKFDSEHTTGTPIILPVVKKTSNSTLSASK